MLYIGCFFFFLQFYGLVKICVSEEFQKKEENFLLKTCTDEEKREFANLQNEGDECRNIEAHMNPLDASLGNETNSEQNIQEVLFVLNDKIYNLPCYIFDLQNSPSSSQNNTSNLQVFESTLQNIYCDLPGTSSASNEVNVTENNSINLQTNTSSSQNNTSNLQVFESTLQSIYCDIPGTSSASNEVNVTENNSINLQTNTSSSQNNTSNLQVFESTLQNIYCDLPSTSSAYYEVNVTENNSINLQTNTSSSQNNTSNSQVFESILQSIYCDLPGTSSASNEVNVTGNNSINLQGTTYDPHYIYFVLQSNINNSQNAPHDLRNNSFNLQNSSSNFQTNSALQFVYSILRTNVDNLQDELINLQNNQSDSQYKTCNLQYTSINSGAVDNFIKNTISSLQNVINISCEEKMNTDNNEKDCNSLLKRKCEQITEDSVKKRKLRKRGKEDKVTICESIPSCSTDSPETSDSTISNKSFISLLLSNVFELDLEKLLTMIFSLQNKFNSLKDEYNEFAKVLYFNIDSLKRFSDIAIQDIDPTILDEMEDHYFKNKTYKYMMNNKKFFLLLASNEKEKYIIKNEQKIINAIRSSISCFNSLLSGIKRILESHKIMERVLNSSLYYEFFVSKYILISEESALLYNEIFQNLDDLMNITEVSLEKGTLPFNKLNIDLLGDLIDKYNNSTMLFNRCFKDFEAFFGSQNISYKDNKMLVKTLFHLLNDQYMNNKIIFNERMITPYEKNISEIISKILLEEEEDISFYRNKASTLVNLKDEEMNINNTSLAHLLGSETGKRTLISVCENILRSLRYLFFLKKAESLNKIFLFFKKINTIISEKKFDENNSESKKLVETSLNELKDLRKIYNETKLSIGGRSSFLAIRQNILAIQDYYNSLLSIMNLINNVLVDIIKTNDNIHIRSRKTKFINRLKLRIIYMLFYISKVTKEFNIKIIQ